MKTITDRYEVAKALNFNKYPVLNLDLAKDKAKEDYLEGCYLGQKVRFKETTRQGESFYWHGQLCYFKDSGLSISSDSACITASFGYRDIAEDLKNANAPIVAPNTEVVVVIHDSTKRVAIVCLTTIESINPNCSTAIQFEEGFKSIVKMVENFNVPKEK